MCSNAECGAVCAKDDTVPKHTVPNLNMGPRARKGMPRTSPLAR